MKPLFENWRKYLTEVVYSTSQFLKNDRHAYAILANLADQEVPLNIDQKNLKKLYRQIARQLHPDRNPNDANAAENLLQSGEAYNYILKKIENKPHDFRYFRDPSKNRGFGEIADKPPYTIESGTVKPTKGTTSQKPPPTGTTGRGEWTTAHTSNPYTTKKDRSTPPPRQEPKQGPHRAPKKGENFESYMKAIQREDIVQSIKNIYRVIKDALEYGKKAEATRSYRDRFKTQGTNQYRIYVRTPDNYAGPMEKNHRIETKDYDNLRELIRGQDLFRIRDALIGPPWSLRPGWIKNVQEFVVLMNPKYATATGGSLNAGDFSAEMGGRYSDRTMNSKLNKERAMVEAMEFFIRNAGLFIQR